RHAAPAQLRRSGARPPVGRQHRALDSQGGPGRGVRRRRQGRQRPGRHERLQLRSDDLVTDRIDTRLSKPLLLGLAGAGLFIAAPAGLWSFAGLPWMVAGRFVQGVGGGGLVPLSLALAADLYRDRARTSALGSIAAMQEAGSVFGPLYGATIAAAAANAGGWRFVFWLNIPLAAICAGG